MAILFANHNQKTALSQNTAHIINNKLAEHVKQPPISTQIAQQVILYPYTPCSLLFTTSASGLHTVKSRSLKKSTKNPFTAYGVRYALLLQLFNIPQSRLSAKAMQLPKRKVEYVTDPPKALVFTRPPPHQQALMVTPKKADKSAHRDDSFAGGDTTTTNGKDKDVASNIIRAIHKNHRPPKSRR